jgi:SNF2 family DNA or RNA helicase
LFVVHGIWANGALCLWAEDSQLAPISPSRPGRPSRTPRPHPFAADATSLVDVVAHAAGHASAAIDSAAMDSAATDSAAIDSAAIDSAAIDSAAIDSAAIDIARKAVENEVVLLLPSAAQAPLASPELARGPDASPPATTRRALTRWQVPALAFDRMAATAILGLLDGPQQQQEQRQQHEQQRRLAETALGGSWQFFAAVARTAADLVARGRVLPALVDAGAAYRAQWRPVLAGADAKWAQELAAAMPPVCRSAAEGLPSAAILIEALDAFVDATVRATLAASSARPYRLLPPRRGRKPAHVPLAERWIDGLTSPDGHVPELTGADSAEVGDLVRMLEGWRAEAQRPAGPVTTCFWLAEPAGPAPGADADWRIHFALQATDDPSLVIAAEDVWTGASAGVDRPEEALLTGLGRAARLYPDLHDALRTPKPVCVTTDVAGAYRFLKEVAPLLAGAGFGVRLPAWAGKSRLGLKLTTRSKQSGQSARAGRAAKAAGFGLDEILQFRFDLAVGDDTVDAAELAALARLKVPLVRLRGQWVELDDRRLQAAITFLERHGEGSMRAGEVLPTALRGVDGDEEADSLPVVAVEADGWLGDLLSGHADERLTPMATPEGFAGTLRPYQQRGLAWLAFLGRLGLGAVLADDMGLGKTVQLLALLMAERAEPTRPDASSARRPTLLVCPMSLVGNWHREAQRFTPDLAVHVHHGGDRLVGEELRSTLAVADLVITTYALAARDREALAEVQWGRVVCDEAQNIKNSGTRQARAVRSLPAESTIALTGTPVENHLAELWSIMEFANPGLLGSAARFKERYAIPIERHGSEQAATALKRITGPFVLRRLKTDRLIISDLPDKLEMKVWCNLTAEQASLYQATVDDMLAKVEESEGIERRGLVLATMAKLKQVCNHPAHLLRDGTRLAGRSGKLARLEEILGEVVAQRDKALCFTQYAEFGALLEPYLAAHLGVPVHYLHGGTPKRQRDALVSRFQEATDPTVFLLSLKAGGTGLNLTAANHVVHIDRWWNPAVEDQATDRAFRIGQRKNVQVRKFVCVGTLEERIDRMIEDKKALAERIVGTGESWLTELSVAELREVVALSPDAVAE